jgi:hypothetical protein
VKLGAKVVVWVLAIAFIFQWIYEFDSCRHGPDAGGPVTCLVASLTSTYFMWWLIAIAHFVKLVFALL